MLRSRLTSAIPPLTLALASFTACEAPDEAELEPGADAALEPSGSALTASPTDATRAGDRDGDGFTVRQGDCRDDDKRVHPGAFDPDGDRLDQDCGGRDGAQPHVGLNAASSGSIQAAIDAAKAGDTVWIAPGTWQEANIRFKGKAITLASTGGPEVTIIDAQQQGSVLIFDAGETAATKVQGFTLTGGKAQRGGGIYASKASPTLTDLVVIENSAFWGGGVYLAESKADISSSIIADNFTPDTCWQAGMYAYCYGDKGGGAYLRRSDATITHTTFIGNHSDQGGGLAMESSSPTLSHLTFQENVAERHLAGSGGALYSYGSSPLLENSHFFANKAEYKGGAIYLLESNGLLTNLRIEGNVAARTAGMEVAAGHPLVSNVVLARNKATHDPRGGALGISSSAAVFSHLTVVDNYTPPADPQSGFTAAAVYVSNVTQGIITTLEDSILAYNTESNLAVWGPCLVSYTDLYNPAGMDNHDLSPLPPTNLTVEPKMLRYGSDGVPSDYHLALGSPLVDAGNPDLADVDGSRTDPGAYGGAKGGSFDLDADGAADWFWPGELEDAPADFDPAEWDCRDLDGTTTECGG